jgi:hypothetical protein
MNDQQIKGTHIHDFPDTPNVRQSLYWMGENYLEYILEGFSEQFKKQDAATQILSIKCVSEPVFSYKVSSKDGKFHETEVSFNLEFILRDGSTTKWQLRGTANYHASDLHTGEPKISLDFELKSSEKM